MKRLLHLYYRFLQAAMTLCIALLIVPVTMQILSRYTGLIPRYIWTEEIARFCFIWVIMLGAMIAVRDGSHFVVDVLPEFRSARTAALADLFVHAMMLLFALVFIYYGYRFAEFGSLQRSEIAGLPMLSIFIAWPLAGLTWVLFLLEPIADDLRRLRGSADAAADAS